MVGGFGTTEMVISPGEQVSVGKPIAEKKAGVQENVQISIHTSLAHQRATAMAIQEHSCLKSNGKKHPMLVDVTGNPPAQGAIGPNAI